MVREITLRQVGGSIGATIPRDMAERLHLDVGDRMLAVETAFGPDNGVWPLYQLFQLFDTATNFGPANQYLPTDATTKLQIRGSTWGTNASFMEVLTRLIRPVSGAALFA